jgi:hypothetical protein
LPPILVLSIAISSYPLCTLPTHSFQQLTPELPRLWPILKYGGDKNGYSLPPPTISKTTTAILMRLRRIPTRDLYPDCESESRNLSTPGVADPFTDGSTKALPGLDTTAAAEWRPLVAFLVIHAFKRSHPLFLSAVCGALERMSEESFILLPTHLSQSSPPWA